MGKAAELACCGFLERAFLKALLRSLPLTTRTQLPTLSHPSGVFLGPTQLLQRGIPIGLYSAQLVWISPEFPNKLLKPSV